MLSNLKNKNMDYLFNFIVVVFMVSFVIYLVGFEAFKSNMLFRIKKEKSKSIKIFSVILSVATWVYIIVGLLNLAKFIFKF